MMERRVKKGGEKELVEIQEVEMTYIHLRSARSPMR